MAAKTFVIQVEVRTRWWVRPLIRVANFTCDPAIRYAALRLIAAFGYVGRIV